MVNPVSERPLTPTGAGGATLGAVGIYLSLGVGLAILAFSAAAFIDQTPADDAESAAGGALSSAIALMPFVAAPILAVVAGVWAGLSTGSGARGALAGAVGSVVGVIVMMVLVAVGLGLGAAVGGAGDANVNVDEGTEANVNDLRATLGTFATVNGLAFLLAHAIIGGIAGAILGAIMPRIFPYGATDVDRRPLRTV